MLKCLLTVAMATGLLLLLPGAASARRCAGVDVLPTANNLPVVKRGLACLHDRTRARRRLSRLARSPRLGRAAGGHAARMVRQGYFSHLTPSGATAADRVRRARYAPGRIRCVGENLAWGTGDRATARQVFRAWLASPPHRAILLDRRYRALGVGITTGAPGITAPDAATFTVVYAARR
jgi:hypothetical protein